MTDETAFKIALLFGSLILNCNGNQTTSIVLDNTTSHLENSKMEQHIQSDAGNHKYCCLQYNICSYKHATMFICIWPFQKNVLYLKLDVFVVNKNWIILMNELGLIRTAIKPNHFLFSIQILLEKLP